MLVARAALLAGDATGRLPRRARRRSSSPPRTVPGWWAAAASLHVEARIRAGVADESDVARIDDVIDATAAAGLAAACAEARVVAAELAAAHGDWTSLSATSTCRRRRSRSRRALPPRPVAARCLAAPGVARGARDACAARGRRVRRADRGARRDRVAGPRRPARRRARRARPRPGRGAVTPGWLRVDRAPAGVGPRGSRRCARRTMPSSPPTSTACAPRSPSSTLTCARHATASDPELAPDARPAAGPDPPPGAATAGEVTRSLARRRAPPTTSSTPDSRRGSRSSRSTTELLALRRGRRRRRVVDARHGRRRPREASHVAAALTMHLNAVGRGIDRDPAACSPRPRRPTPLLLRPLDLPDGPVVLSPIAGLHDLPWGAAAVAADRSFVLAPSAGAVEAVPDATPAPARRASPSPARAAVRRTRRPSRWPRATAAHGLTASEATVPQSSEAMGGADVAHLVCHGRFSAENPMFSSLQLADGPMFVYDLERLDAGAGHRGPVGMPRRHARHADRREILGLTASLLASGPRAVIAATVPIPDTFDRRRNDRLHTLLAAGEPRRRPPRRVTGPTRSSVAPSPATARTDPAGPGRRHYARTSGPDVESVGDRGGARSAAGAGHALGPERDVPHGLGGLLPGGTAGPRGLGRRPLDGRTPVTVAEFRRFVRETGYVTVAERAARPGGFPGADPDCWCRARWCSQEPSARSISTTSATGGRTCPAPAGSGRAARHSLRADEHPVVHVAYEDAEAYATWGEGAADRGRVGARRAGRPRRREVRLGRRATLPAASGWPTPGKASSRGRTCRGRLRGHLAGRRASRPTAMASTTWPATSGSGRRDWYTPRHPGDGAVPCCVPTNPRASARRRASTRSPATSSPAR